MSDLLPFKHKLRNSRYMNIVAKVPNNVLAQQLMMGVK